MSDNKLRTSCAELDDEPCKSSRRVWRRREDNLGVEGCCCGGGFEGCCLGVDAKECCVSVSNPDFWVV